MSIEIVGITVLAVVFVLAALRSLNMGALALVAAYVLGVVVMDLPLADVIGGFPGGLFVVLLGVTFLFGIARTNGTVDWLVTVSMSLVRDRAGAVPWVLFFLAAALASVGAASPAAVAIVAPIGITFAIRNGISPLYAGLLAVNGAAAGSFSPIGILGGIVTSTLAKNGMAVDQLMLFGGTFAFNALLSVVAYLVFGRKRISPPPQPLDAATESAGPTTTMAKDECSESGGTSVRTKVDPAPSGARTRQRLTTQQGLTLGGIASLVVLTTAFGLDAGFSALLIAVVLAVLYPSTAETATKEIAWPVILMVCGIVTYISLLESQGIVDSLGHTVSMISAPALAALVIVYIGGVVSAFASTTAILGALVPLSIPFLVSGSVSTTGLIVALCAAATVVDASPFSTNGALVISNSPASEQKLVYRGLLLWGAAVTLIAPAAAWLIFTVV